MEDWALDTYADKGGAAVISFYLSRDLHRPPTAKIGTPEGDSERRKIKASGY